MSNEKGFYGLGKAGFGVLTGVIAVLAVLFKLGVFGGQDKSHLESRVARIEAAIEKQGDQLNKALTGIAVLNKTVEHINENIKRMQEYSKKKKSVKPVGFLVKHIESDLPKPKPKPKIVKTATNEK